MSRRALVWSRCAGRLPRVVRFLQPRRCAAAGSASAHRGPPRELLTGEQRGAAVSAGAARRGIHRGPRFGDRVALRQWRLRSRISDSCSADLVQRKVDVIVTDVPTFAAHAVQRATSTIPIVIAIAADPVGSGLVTNLAHPGGNVTGVSIMIAELSAKRLQLLADAIPRLTRVAVLWDPATPYHRRWSRISRRQRPRCRSSSSSSACERLSTSAPAVGEPTSACAGSVRDRRPRLSPSTDATHAGVQGPAASLLGTAASSRTAG